MKKVNVVGLQPDPEGPQFGRVFKSSEWMKSQEFEHDHIKRVVKNMLVAGAGAAQVAGFAATLPGALGVEIAVGDVVDANGNCYEMDEVATVTLGAADPAQPRIDLIYAMLSIDAPAESRYVPFKRLLSSAEVEAGISYPPEQFFVATELHTVATINVRAGTPSGAPVAPALKDRKSVV